jgi:hypothetical protein
MAKRRGHGPLAKFDSARTQQHSRFYGSSPEWHPTRHSTSPRRGVSARCRSSRALERTAPAAQVVASHSSRATRRQIPGPDPDPPRHRTSRRARTAKRSWLARDRDQTISSFAVDRSNGDAASKKARCGLNRSAQRTCWFLHGRLTPTRLSLRNGKLGSEGPSVRVPSNSTGRLGACYACTATISARACAPGPSMRRVQSLLTAFRESTRRITFRVRGARPRTGMTKLGVERRRYERSGRA